jgi:hypothetical protein
MVSQHVKHGLLNVLGIKKSDGGIGLRVEVDQERFLVSIGDAGSKINGGGCLSHAALLIGNSQDGGHKRPGRLGAGAKPPLGGNPCGKIQEYPQPSGYTPIYSPSGSSAREKALVGQAFSLSGLVGARAIPPSSLWRLRKPQLERRKFEAERQ